MNRILFKDLTNSEQYVVRLKLATGKYEISNQFILVKINLIHDKEVIVSKEDKNELCLEFSVWEPIYKNVEECLKFSCNANFINALEGYKREYINLGSEITNRIFLKCYQTKKTDEVERDNVGRIWIDYNNQLLNGKYIYDDNGCGIWATNPKHLNKIIEAAWRYGENIMVLSPVEEVEYAVSDLEVVGDKFEVKMYGSLKCEETWNELVHILGETVIVEMSQDNINKYDGAKKIYEKYLSRSECIQTEQIPKKRSVIDYIKLFLLRKFLRRVIDE